MSSKIAVDKFLKVVRKFQAVDESVRQSKSMEIDEREFQTIITDLNTVIPDLTGRELGLALLFKANSLYWLYIKDMTQNHAKYEQYYLENLEPLPNTHKNEGLSCATKGKNILEESGDTAQLPWASSIVRLLS